MDDPFSGLRLPSPTPDEKTCRCTELPAIMLRDSLGPCPIYCVECNGEVTPERVPMDRRIAEDVASWLSVENALYRLWLESGDFEEMAAAALSDPNAEVNRTGRQLATKLTERGMQTYLWWFVPDPDSPPACCPCCAGAMTDWPTRRFRFCEPCRIIL